jgi:hypothetical protein
LDFRSGYVVDQFASPVFLRLLEQLPVARSCHGDRAVRRRPDRQTVSVSDGHVDVTARAPMECGALVQWPPHLDTGEVEKGKRIQKFSTRD